MRDLSSLARDSMWPTSQEGGNMVHDNSPAMTAPGSEPVTPVPKAEAQPDPTVPVPAARPVGDTGRGQPGKGYTPSAMAWKAAGNG